MSYRNDTTIYAVISRPLSRLQEIKSVDQNLAALDSWCLKHTRFNSRKTKSMAVSRSRTYALGSGGLTLGGAQLEEVNFLRILLVTLLLVEV